ncbi:PREDICTED: U1 small nuclear ribonucleoprotein 70 kDa-like [Ipomoea nil]|uniref:U1 small nuclear ribonucleoprotein 70 kDa-like n=1 Tax=Ipomoea nil TaxID=35883 RepID=UPI0009016278|nr:PREDICTED: U1 small nuclear ribonucleoprotein 70 kDa-like [Ipomoea nil]
MFFLLCNFIVEFSIFESFEFEYFQVFYKKLYCDSKWILRTVTKEVETRAQRRARVHKIRLEEGAKKVAEELKKYGPNNDPNVTGDPYKTPFVARLNYETTENRNEAYGPIKRVGITTHCGAQVSEIGLVR